MHDILSRHGLHQHSALAHSAHSLADLGLSTAPLLNMAHWACDQG
jgi:hypothetical protein